MKKKIKALIATLLATTCATSVFALTACEGKNNPPPQKTECTQHVDKDDNGLCDNCGEKMPEDEPPQDDAYEISISGNTSVDLDVGASQKLEWSVYKNGSVVTNEKVNVTLNNDNVSYNEQTQMLTGVKKGQTTVTLTLERDEDVKKTLRVTVRNFFFNHEMNRGSWNSALEDNETNPKISVIGGQAAIPVKNSATQFVFKYTLDMAATDVATNQSFGIASYIPKSGEVGDNAMWFGLRGTGVRGVFGLYVKQFYPGWGVEGGYEAIPTGYANLGTGFTDVEFVIIRDGLDYYCSIGGYYYKYTVSDSSYEDVESYAGIYSQELAFDVSKYSYSSEQADVDAAIEEYYTNRGVAVISINETYQNEMVKGESTTFTAAAYPTDRAAGVNLVWTVDKAEMTAGDATVTGSGGSATLALSEDAAGYVTLVCATEDGDVEQRLRIEILEHSLNGENDYVNTYGGVLIGGEGENYTLTFPESRINKNGISLAGGNDEEIYRQTNYCAVFKTNPSKDYTVEFKFSNYRANTNTPKLQVSLGADKNNFYLVYNNAGQFRVESFTQGTESNGFTTATWHNTQWINNFNPSAPHSFKLTVSDRGVYNVYIDGTIYPFYATDAQQQLANQTTVVRQYANYDRALPVKLATSGCSVELSEIKITDGTHESIEHTFWSMHQSYTFQGEDGFTMVTPVITDPNADGWQYGQWSDYKMYYTGALDDGGYALEYDVNFGDLMNDAKFVMRVGSEENCGNANSGAYELQFTSKPSGVGLTLRRGGNWQDGKLKIDPTDNLKIKVRVELKGGNLRVIANGRIIFNENHPANKIADNANIEFYMFNKTADDVWSTSNPNKYAKLSHFTVEGSDFTAADVYELNSTVDNNILVVFAGGTGDPIPVQIKHNGQVISANDEYTLTYTLDGDDADKFELSENGTIKGKSSAALGTYDATVTVSLKKGEEVIDTMDFIVTFINKPTTNNFVEVTGGVILDTEGDDDENYSITFPESRIGTNGIGNEARYEENAYSANLKQKVQGDTTVEFTVSNLVTQGESPKLMVSLGGEHNQLYFVYKTGVGFRLEVVIPRVNTGHGIWEDDGWLTSDWQSDFNPSVPNTFKIELKGGKYTVYRKVGDSYNAIIVGENGNFGSHTMAASYESYMAEKPVRISTSNSACVVSGIKITTGTFAPYYSTTSVVNYTDGKLVINALREGWNNEGGQQKGNPDKTRARYTAGYADGKTLEFDLDFNKAMRDGKFAVNIAGVNLYIENKLADNGKINLCGNGDWGDRSTTINDTDGVYKLHVKVVRNGNGISINVTGGASEMNFETSGDNISGNDSLYFWIFNQDDDGAAVTVSNLSITNNA